MNLISRTITGIIMIALGLFLIVLSFFVKTDALWATLVYGIPMFFIGFYILFNKKEDKIEKIKRRK